MKKIYISPEIFSITLDPKMPLLLGTSDTTGDPEEGQFTKGHVADDDASTGSKNVWDEEW